MQRDLKLIKKIILHCSDTDVHEFDNIAWIDKIHRGKGWKMVGYHYFITKKGKIEEGRKLEQVGAHCAGYNMCSIGICLSGKKIFYEEQFSMAWFLISDLMRRFNLTRKDIHPHHEFNPYKTCPNFDLSKIFKYDDNSFS